MTEVCRGRSRDLPRQEWHTLILDAHPAYITWRDYEDNLRLLQENAQTSGVEKRSAVREGPSLLQGLAICGVCGKQNPAMVAELDRLLDDYNYADVARILKEKVQNRRWLAVDITSRWLYSNSLQTQEPLRSAS